MSSLPTVAELTQYAVILIGFLAAWVGVLKAASALFGAVGAWAPWAKTAAAWCAKAATQVHLATEDLANLLPGTAGAKVRAAAKRAATVAAILLGLALPAVATSACTPAQSAADQKVVNEVATLADQACVDAALALPIADPSLPAVDEQALKQDCPAIANLADSTIDALISDFTEQPAVAAQLEKPAALARVPVVLRSLHARAAR